ncbi:MAG: NIPSNAP family protein [Acidimicrobiia bacterium]
MLYELREYQVAPGRLSALNERFANIALRYFEKHDIEPIAFWTEMVGSPWRLTYLVRYRDMAHRELAWNGFANDADRLAEFAETEKDGPLVLSIRNRLLAPTDYSPLT